MDKKAMEPFGKALLDFHRGVFSSRLFVRRDDGLEEELPLGMFFRSEEESSAIDRLAIESCRSPVLDVGGGAGSCSLVLQARGIEVTAIDISPHAVEVMKDRGVKAARCADVYSFEGPVFDTLLLLGRSIGMVETVEGLERFLKKSHRLLNDRGQILCDSLDVRQTDDPKHLSYQDNLLKSGRYFGEIRIRLEYGNLIGPWHRWLHVDRQTLSRCARDVGFEFALLIDNKYGEYLARLSL